MTRLIYERGRTAAADRGIIIADTKFEFGRAGERILLVDEVLTPDSSRFWPADGYAPGRTQASFDKQPLRDYLDSRTPRGPVERRCARPRRCLPRSSRRRARGISKRFGG